MPYSCLNYLKNQGIKFKFTPFAQAAMVEIFDKDWSGSCDVLANEWMYRKICAQHIDDVVTYEITDPHLPHIVVTGDRSPEGPDIQKVRFLVDYAFESSRMGFGQSQIDAALSPTKKSDEITRNESLENLLKFIGSQTHSSGIIASLINFSTSKGKKESGHALAFVKRGDAISFFDPNNGELTFDKFSDFCIWFRAEATVGALRYILNDPHVDPKKRESLKELHSQSSEVEFSNASQKTKKESKLEIDPVEEKLKKRIQEIRDKKIKNKAKVKTYLIEPYRLIYWGANQYQSPEKYEKYFSLNCDLVLMHEVPNENDFFLKKLLSELRKEIYIVVGTNLYFARKVPPLNTIEVTKLKVNHPQGFENFLSLITTHNVNLKDNEKFKVMNTAPLSPKILCFIDENTHHRYLTKIAEVETVTESKNESEKFFSSNHGMNLFSENASIYSQDEFFERATIFLKNLEKLSEHSNNNTMLDHLSSKLRHILNKAKYQIQLNDLNIDDIKQICNEKILNALAEVEDKVIIENYMNEVEPYSRTSATKITPRYNSYPHEN